MQTSKTLETVIVAVLVIAAALTIYSQMSTVLSGLLEKAVNVQSVR